MQAEAEGKELTIKAMENKNDGTLVVRVNVPSELDLHKIEESFWQKYQGYSPEA
ncbi:MAG: hypothetical protein WA865_09835 [Spirulinaceae cyanobacterium]